MSKRMSIFMFCIVVAVVLVVGPMLTASAASTTKPLSTNYTLVNLGTSEAHVVVQYLLENGSSWTAPAASTTFTITANGGQKIVRQYLDAMTPSSGRGSAIVSSDEPLGAVVQILAYGQPSATSGAYSGFTAGSNKFYVPLLARRGSTATGLANSQIMIQNVGSSPITVSVNFIGTVNFTNNSISIAAGATYYYDLDDETNLGTNWFGSAVVQAGGGGEVAVVANFFTGPDGLQTYNAFPASNVGPKWLVPLFTSRLPNTLNTPIAVQNLSGASIPVGGLSLACTPDVNSTNQNVINKQNTTAIANNASYYFNPVTDLTIPDSWAGSCVVNAGTSNVVVFVQMRYLNAANAAAYEAINASSTDTNAVFPLIAKRLGNGFATAVTIQNLSSSSSANVTLTYTPSPDCGAPCIGGVLATTAVISPSASLIQNQRLSGFTVGATSVPDQWLGTLTVKSTNGTPISGFVQLTYVVPKPGDTFMAHDAFTQP